MYTVLSTFKEHWNKRQTDGQTDNLVIIVIVLYSFIDTNEEESDPVLALYIFLKKIYDFSTISFLCC